MIKIYYEEIWWRDMMKRYDGDIWWIDMMRHGMIDKVQWIKGKMQLADPLSKLGVCTDKIKNAVSRD